MKKEEDKDVVVLHPIVLIVMVIVLVTVALFVASWLVKATMLHLNLLEP
ncbi:MAG: hypothetical protein AAB510_02400 [Patescibacteria group bacterium]